MCVDPASASLTYRVSSLNMDASNGDMHVPQGATSERVNPSANDYPTRCAMCPAMGQCSFCWTDDTSAIYARRSPRKHKPKVSPINTLHRYCSPTNASARPSTTPVKRKRGAAFLGISPFSNKRVTASRSVSRVSTAHEVHSTFRASSPSLQNLPVAPTRQRASLAGISPFSSCHLVPSRPPCFVSVPLSDGENEESSERPGDSSPSMKKQGVSPFSCPRL